MKPRSPSVAERSGERAPAGHRLQNLVGHREAARRHPREQRARPGRERLDRVIDEVDEVERGRRVRRAPDLEIAARGPRGDRPSRRAGAPAGAPPRRRPGPRATPRRPSTPAVSSSSTPSSGLEPVQLQDLEGRAVLEVGRDEPGGHEDRHARAREGPERAAVARVDEGPRRTARRAILVVDVAAVGRVEPVVGTERAFEAVDDQRHRLPAHGLREHLFPRGARCVLADLEEARERAADRVERGARLVEGEEQHRAVVPPAPLAHQRGLAAPARSGDHERAGTRDATDRSSPAHARGR